MIETGSFAPSFQLPDQNGKTVSLQDLAGRWVVLYFYPKDDTPGCTVQACEFTAALPALGDLDAVVFGCSADGATEHQQFIAKYSLGIGLLTDADRAVMNAYGAWGKKMFNGKEVEGVIRSTVVIAPDGRIAHHWPKVTAEGHAEAVRAKLAELQGVAAPKKVVRAASAKGKATKAVKPMPKMKTKPMSMPKAKAKAMPKAKTIAKTIAKTTSKPIAKAIAKPVAKAIAKPKGKAKPVAKPKPVLKAKKAAPKAAKTNRKAAAKPKLQTKKKSKV